MDTSSISDQIKPHFDRLVAPSVAGEIVDPRSFIAHLSADAAAVLATLNTPEAASAYLVALSQAASGYLENVHGLVVNEFPESEQQN